MELKKIDMNMNISGGASHSQNVNLINNFKNLTTNTNLQAGTGINKDIGEWFFAALEYNFNYNISGSTIQDNAQIKY
jgi:hypothetical protein